MERDEAIEKLRMLEGKNLHEVASQYEVRIRTPEGKVNKGWAGHVCERHLGLSINSSQSPDFGTWELKVVPIKLLVNGSWTYKETMAITMIDPLHVKNHEFEDSHLFSKLKKIVLVVRKVGINVDEPTFVHKVAPVDLKGELLNEVINDYNIVRTCLLDPNRGFSHLTGAMGKYVQPRTKGAGHGSTSRAFYARPSFLQSVVPI